MLLEMIADKVSIKGDYAGAAVQFLVFKTFYNLMILFFNNLHKADKRVIGQLFSANRGFFLCLGWGLYMP